MPVPTTIADLNVTASLNSPAGSEAIGTSLDDYIRAHGSIIKQHEADLASPASGKGAGLSGFSHAATYTAGTSGAKHKQSVDVRDAPYNATGDGVAGDSTEVALAFTSNAGRVIEFQYTGSTYKLESDVTVPAGNYGVRLDPGVSFSTSKLILNNLVPYQVTPVTSYDVISRSYNENGYGNIFQRGSYVKQSGTSPCVAMFGEGDAAGGPTWGGNFVGVASTNVVGSVAIAAEINPVNVGGANAKAYGLVVASAGNFPAENFLQAQANTAASTFKNGLVIDSSLQNAISGSLFKTQGAGSCVSGIDLIATTFSGNAFASPGFAVDGSGGATIGSGTKITKHLSGTQALNFGSIGAGSTASTGATITGAAVGDSVTATPNAALASGFTWSAFVSAPNTVTLVLANCTVANADPDGAGITWRFDVWQH